MRAKCFVHWKSLEASRHQSSIRFTWFGVGMASVKMLSRCARGLMLSGRRRITMRGPAIVESDSQTTVPGGAIQEVEAVCTGKLAGAAAYRLAIEAAAPT